MTAAPWRTDDDERVAAIFSQHIDYDAAFAEVCRTVRQCTKAALKELMTRRGKPAPSTFLRPAVATTPANEVYAAQVAALDYDDVAETRKTDPIPSPPEPDIGFSRVEPIVPPPPPTRNSFESFRFVLIPDCHVPYHDERAFQAALRVVRFVQPTHLILMGDFADFYCVSSHDRSPARVSQLKGELAVCAEKLSEIDAVARNCVSKQYLEGNHENRAGRYIAKKAPELHGLTGTTSREFLDVDSRGWNWTNYGEEHRIGETRMSHEFGDCGVHALKRALEATRSDCAIGHTHLLGSLDAEHPATGKTITATSFGWLGSFKDIDYANRTKIMSRWRHGVGVGFGRADGTMRRECVRLTEGMPIVVDGQRV